MAIAAVGSVCGGDEVLWNNKYLETRVVDIQ
jgi:hypothetical protein